MSKEKRWVIVGVHGLYVGQKTRRNDMIAQHVGERLSGINVPGGPPFAEMPDFPVNGLSKEQRRAWAWCKRQGDRCVHATISWK